MAKQSAYLNVDPPLSQNEQNKVKRSLSLLPGVLSVAIGSQSDTVSVDFDSTGIGSHKIEETLRNLRSEAWITRVEEHLM